MAEGVVGPGAGFEGGCWWGGGGGPGGGIGVGVEFFDKVGDVDGFFVGR